MYANVFFVLRDRNFVSAQENRDNRTPNGTQPYRSRKSAIPRVTVQRRATECSRIHHRVEFSFPLAFGDPESIAVRLDLAETSRETKKKKKRGQKHSDTKQLRIPVDEDIGDDGDVSRVDRLDGWMDGCFFRFQRGVHGNRGHDREDVAELARFFRERVDGAPAEARPSRREERCDRGTHLYR